MPLIEVVLTGIIAFLSGSIGATVAGYFLIKKLKTEASDIIFNILNDSLVELPKLMARDDVRQFIYSIGVLIGNGAKSGIGLSKTGGKFKWEDLLGQIIPNILPQVFKNQPGAATPGQEVTKPW